MADPQIEKLLIVQDRDATLQKIEQELAHLPQQRAAINQQIKVEEFNMTQAQQSLKEKEVRRMELDSEVKAKETAIQRFKNQQLEVKKNEEYKALTHQVEQSESEISALEEQEIELMLEIDTARESYEQQKSVIEARILVQHEEIEQLAEREKNLAASITEAQAKLAAAREVAEGLYLEHYDRVKQLTRRAPYVVLIEAHKCGGCHLRVSNEVAHSVLNSEEPHFCDQCARIVYA